QARALAVAVAATALWPGWAQERGEADIGSQGYYVSGTGQPLIDASGLAIHFRYFLPEVGFLAGSLEGYRAEGGMQAGENYLQLRGVPWAGRHWTFTAGDFRFAGNPLQLPFSNVAYPEILGRGFGIEASHAGTDYTVFWGT